MRNHLLLVPIFLFSACTEDHAPALDQVDNESRAAFLREQEQDRAKFAKIDYPACKKLWNGQKLTKCGDQVLQKSLTECANAAGEKVNGPIALIDQWTGDSWQERAGVAATPIQERGSALTPSDGYVEQLAYAKGNGTDDIGNITCTLNARLRLDFVSVY